MIAVADDEIELRDGQVFINGVQLEENYIFEGEATVSTGGQSSWVIPKDQLFVMGDHRNNSADSRVFGPIEKGQVVGRAWLRYWPFSTFGILPTPTHPELSEAGPATP